MIEFEHLTYSYPADMPDQARPARVHGSKTALWRLLYATVPQSLCGTVGYPVLCDVSLRIGEGNFVLVIGPSGAGKSTLLRCLNGLVPHFYGGTISGRIRVAGRDPIALTPRRMSEVVGFVFQDPETQAVVDVVEDELAFAMENHGLPPNTMRRRIEEVLDRLGIVHLRRRQISTLSGGERQRVAIAAVLALQPQVLVLDEPTSQLDPQAAEEVLDALVKLNHDLGLTIVLSEHRLERVAAYAEQILYLPGDGQPVIMGKPDEVLAKVPLVPPVVELGRRLGWSPLPLTVEDARQFAQTARMRERLSILNRDPAGQLAGQRPPATQRIEPVETQYATVPQSLREAYAVPDVRVDVPDVRVDVPDVRVDSPDVRVDSTQKEPALEIDGLRFAYNSMQALRGIDLTIQKGEFVALMGCNGVGKSTLLKQCIGLLKPDKGRVRVLGLDTRSTPVEELSHHVGYVPQNPNALLFADTVAEELAFTRRAQGMPPSDDEPLLRALGLAGMRRATLWAEPRPEQDEGPQGFALRGEPSGEPFGYRRLSDCYPRDLSTGERQRVALAAVLVGDPEIIFLDEPTRGLDYSQKAALVSFLEAQRQRGRTIVVVTHDVELVAQCAERVVLMEDGKIVVDGPVREVMSAVEPFGLSPTLSGTKGRRVKPFGESPQANPLVVQPKVAHASRPPGRRTRRPQLFASQINRLFRDPRYLTVQDVVEALGGDTLGTKGVCTEREAPKQ